MAKTISETSPTDSLQHKNKLEDVCHDVDTERDKPHTYILKNVKTASNNGTMEYDLETNCVTRKRSHAKHDNFMTRERTDSTRTNTLFLHEFQDGHSSNRPAKSKKKKKHQLLFSPNLKQTVKTQSRQFTSVCTVPMC